MKLETQCPKCGFKLDDNRAVINTDDEFVCDSCGHAGNLEQFLSAQSRKRIMETAQKAAIDAFKNLPGFKP